MVDELLGVLRHASGGLYREGEEMGMLCVRQLLVLVVFSKRCPVGSSEGSGAGCGEVRGSKEVGDDDVGEDG